MLDTCPKQRSCGAYWPMWTDAVGPEEVGVAIAAAAYIPLTTNYPGTKNCKYSKREIEIMRCSSNVHDLIYRQVKRDLSSCKHAFCGTN